jgi:hypothetical protein
MLHLIYPLLEQLIARTTEDDRKALLAGRDAVLAPCRILLCPVHVLQSDDATIRSVGQQCGVGTQVHNGRADRSARAWQSNRWEG